jgi:hypothetical protein
MTVIARNYGVLRNHIITSAPEIIIRRLFSCKFALNIKRNAKNQQKSRKQLNAHKASSHVRTPCDSSAHAAYAGKSW